MSSQLRVPHCALPILPNREFTEVDLITAEPILEELSKRSKTLSVFLNCIVPQGWGVAIQWLQNRPSTDTECPNDEMIRKELRDTSLLLLAGPLELPPWLMSFRINNDRQDSPKFDLREKTWTKIKSGEKGAPPAISQRFLSALGVVDIEAGKSEYPCTKGKFTNVKIRCLWKKTDPAAVS